MSTNCDTALNMFEQVQEFHKVMGMESGLNDLRGLLISEEASELNIELLRATGRLTSNPCRANIIKEACDVLYVTLGLLVEMEVDAEAAFSEVHRSNLSKVDDNGQPVRNPRGKILKGKNYSPAMMEQF